MSAKLVLFFHTDIITVVVTIYDIPCKCFIYFLYCHPLKELGHYIFSFGTRQTQLLIWVFKKIRKLSSFQQNSKLSWQKNLDLPRGFLRISCSKLCHFHQNEMETHIFCESWYGNLKKKYLLFRRKILNEWMNDKYHWQIFQPNF